MPAQNPFLAIDRQIIGDIHTSNEVLDNLTFLCDGCGSRFPGSAGERQAVFTFHAARQGDEHRFVPLVEAQHDAARQRIALEGDRHPPPLDPQHLGRGGRRLTDAEPGYHRRPFRRAWAG